MQDPDNSVIDTEDLAMFQCHEKKSFVVRQLTDTN